MRYICLSLWLTLGLSAQTPAPAADEAARLKDQRLARAEKILQDWPNLARYRDENAKVAGPVEVVFMGDSITDGWGRRYGEFFPSKPYLNRGISGQTTPQMLIRFRPDVLAHHPKVVVILAGTNDIAGNTGVMSLDMIEDNYTSMAELARLNGIQVVFSSVLPVSDAYHVMTDRRPPAQIKALNDWMRAYCQKQGLVYLDYFNAMTDDQGWLRKELTYDGLHPNAAGYAVMGPLAQKAIDAALAKTR